MSISTLLQDLLAKKYLREDYLLYKAVSDMGGVVFESKEQINKIESLIWGE